MAIQFNSKKGVIQIPCYRELNLLAHAQMEELEIGSRCGGHGLCGGDRIQVECENPLFLSPVTSDERSHLSEEDIRMGIRLACQVWPQRDDLELRVFPSTASD